MRRLLTAVLILACAVPVLRAQDGGFVIAGRLLDAISGEPVARASVSVETISAVEEGAAVERNRQVPASRPDAGGLPVQVTTGSDGRFRFPNLPEGRYRLIASRRGYQRAEFEEHFGFYAAVICGPKHPEAADLRFSLTPLGSIRGTVLDSSGDPVDAATIQLYMQSSDGSGAVRLRQTGSLRQGSARFSFGDLAPGTYFLAVAAGSPWFAVSGDGTSGTANPLDLAYPPVFFNGAAGADTAQPIVLRGGENVQANFSLHAVPAVHVKVTSEENGEGRPFFQVPQLGTPAFDGVLPVSSGWSGRGGGVPGENGTIFTASVAPGTYTLQGEPGGKTVQLGSDTTLDRPAENDAAVPFSGKVAMVDGSALPTGLRVQLVPVSSGGGAFLFARGGRAGQPLNRRPLDLTLEADGRFAVSAVPSGKYRLLSQGEGSALAVTGMAASGAEVAADLSLSVSSDPVIAAATLAPADRAVCGRVITAAGLPASGVMVLLVPEAPLSPAMTYQQESDSDGTWTLY